MKKSLIQILNRVLRENKKVYTGLIGRIDTSYGLHCYMNNHMIYATTEDIPDFEPAPAAESYQKTVNTMLDTMKIDFIDIQIDIETLKAYKKEFKAASSKGGKKPYIIKINDGGKVNYIGINPAYLLDLLTFTGTDTIRINADGLKDKYYKLPFYSEGSENKGLLLPVNVNPKTDIEPEANQEVDILRAKNPVKGFKGVTTEKHTPEAAPEAKKEDKAPADDPAYLLAVWYAENVILKKKTA